MSACCKINGAKNADSFMYLYEIALPSTHHCAQLLIPKWQTPPVVRSVRALCRLAHSFLRESPLCPWTVIPSLKEIDSCFKEISRATAVRLLCHIRDTIVPQV